MTDIEAECMAEIEARSQDWVYRECMASIELEARHHERRLMIDQCREANRKLVIEHEMQNLRFLADRGYANMIQSVETETKPPSFREFLRVLFSDA
jgi:hypothetical protein